MFVRGFCNKGGRGGLWCLCVYASSDLIASNKSQTVNLRGSGLLQHQRRIVPVDLRLAHRIGERLEDGVMYPEWEDGVD